MQVLLICITVSPAICPEACKIFLQVFSHTFFLTILTVLVQSATLLVSLLSPFPRSLTSMSMSTVPSSIPQVTFPSWQEGTISAYLLYPTILPSNQLINNPETPLSLMAFAFSKAFREALLKALWKSKQTLPARLPFPQKLPTNSQASTDHMLKTYSPSPGYSIHLSPLNTNNLFTFRNPQALATLQNLKVLPRKSE